RAPVERQVSSARATIARLLWFMGGCQLREEATPSPGTPGEGWGGGLQRPLILLTPSLPSAGVPGEGIMPLIAARQEARPPEVGRSAGWKACTTIESLLQEDVLPVLVPHDDVGFLVAVHVNGHHLRADAG